MEDADSSSTPAGGRRPPAPLVVRDPEQARLLSDPRALTYFEPFLARTRSVSEAAEELDCPLDRLYYRVRRFLGAGLLRVVEERPRAGRAIKRYRSVADAFVVPFEVTPYAELEERLRTLQRQDEEFIVRTTARLLREGGLEGRRIERGSDGSVHYGSAGPSLPDFDWDHPETAVVPGRPVGETLSTEILLTEEEARAMLVTFYRLVLSKPAVVPGERPGGPVVPAGERPRAAGARPYYVRFTILPGPVDTRR